MKKALRFLAVFLVTIMPLLYGCTTYTSRVENASGRVTVYSDPGTVGSSAGIGIESQDIDSMCDKMIRNMMANPILANASRPPQIIVDAAFFRNESTNRINLNLITDNIRSGLLRAANGRMIFIGRHAVGMVEKERKLKKKGIIDQGTTAYTAKTLGGDYRLWGRITTLDAVNPRTGMTTRYTQVNFEMIDLQTSGIVWGGMYKFRKTAADDLIYR